MSLLKERRIQLFLIAVIILGVVPLALLPIQFGMDFSGGSIIQINLERHLNPSEMEKFIT